MKRFLFFFAAVAAVSLFTVSCEDSGDLEDYLPPVVVAGEDLTYYPEIVAVIPGSNRIEVVWKLNAGDRTIGNTYIYWNAGADAYEASISEDTYDEATGCYRQIIEVPEGTYSFFARNLDSDMYISAISPVFEASVFGAIAQSELRDRPMSSIAYDSADFKYTINWGDSETCVGSSVNYTMMTGQKVDRVSTEEDSSVDLTSIAENASIVITSQHVPYRAKTAEGYEDLLASLSMEGAGLDTLSYTGVALEMQGDDSKLIYVTSVKELWEVMNEWDNIDYTTATYEELEANLEAKSNVYLKMEPGVYVVTAENMGEEGIDGVLHPMIKVSSDASTFHSVIMITGDNNVFDFTGVEIQVESASAATSIASGTIRELHIMGNDNIVKGLTLRDTGELDVSPGTSANIRLDGSRNTIEDVTTYVQGCTPYGYGSVFGFGSTSTGHSTTIKYTKHNGLLMGGDNNTARRCSIISKSFGHVIFMQGSEYATLENCYTYADWTTTDKIWEEEGTGSKADLVNFVAYWGSQLSLGFFVSFTEDAYRTYGSGTTYKRSSSTYQWTGHVADTATPRGVESEDSSESSSSGESTEEDDSGFSSRSTKGTYATGCQSNNNRRGFGFSYGSTVGNEVDNHISRGNNMGFSTMSGTEIKTSASDISHGPALQIEGNYKNIKSDITIIPHKEEDFFNYRTSDYSNGNGSVAYIRGSSYTMVFRDGSDGVEPYTDVNGGDCSGDLDYTIGVYMQLGGTNTAEASTVTNGSLSGSYILNGTMYTVRLCSNTKSNYIYLRHGTRVVVEDSVGALVADNSTAFWTAVNQNTFYEYSKEKADAAIAGSVGSAISGSGSKGSIVALNGKYYFQASGQTLTAADVKY